MWAKQEEEAARAAVDAARATAALAARLPRDPLPTRLFRGGRTVVTLVAARLGGREQLAVQCWREPLRLWLLILSACFLAASLEALVAALVVLWGLLGPSLGLPSASAAASSPPPQLDSPEAAATEATEGLSGYLQALRGPADTISSVMGEVIGAAAAVVSGQEASCATAAAAAAATAQAQAAAAAERCAGCLVLCIICAVLALTDDALARLIGSQGLVVWALVQILLLQVTLPLAMPPALPDAEASSWQLLSFAAVITGTLIFSVPSLLAYSHGRAPSVPTDANAPPKATVNTSPATPLKPADGQPSSPERRFELQPPLERRVSKSSETLNTRRKRLSSVRL